MNEALAPGRRVGRYELLKKLGEGGMGSVWLARLTGAGGFQKLCIVKTVLPAIAEDRQFLARFHHEGRILTQLEHGNIAQVYDMAEHEGTLFLALEYVAGVDLARLAGEVSAHDERIPVPIAVYIVQQAVEGLAFAHRRAGPDGTPLRIVHRDVSPQNVMVSFEGAVKVIDFGIARSEARTRHTAQPVVMGKLGYVAPEQARSETVDHRADQYACAVVLWELLTGQPYVARGTLTEMLLAMANPPPPKPLRPLRADVPPLLEEDILKALNADRSQRFPTTDDFSRALLDVLVRLGSMPSPQVVGDYVRTRCTEDFQGQRRILTAVDTLRGAVPLVALSEVTAPSAAQPAVPSTVPAAAKGATPALRLDALPTDPAAHAHAPAPAPAPEATPPPALSHRATSAPAKPAPETNAMADDAAPRKPPERARAREPAPRPFPNPLDDAAPAKPAVTPGVTSSGSSGALKVLLILAVVGLFGLAALGAGAWWLFGRGGARTADESNAGQAGSAGDAEHDAAGQRTGGASAAPAGGPSAPIPTSQGAASPASAQPPSAPGASASANAATSLAADLAADGARSPIEADTATPAAPTDEPLVGAGPRAPSEGTAPGTAAANAGAGGELVQAPFVVGLRESESGFFIRAGRDVGLTLGQTLSVLGAEESPGRRRRLGSATVLEVLDFKATVRVDAAAAAATAGERVVAIPQSGAGAGTGDAVLPPVGGSAGAASATPPGGEPPAAPAPAPTPPVGTSPAAPPAGAAEVAPRGTGSPRQQAGAPPPRVAPPPPARVAPPPPARVAPPPPARVAPPPPARVAPPPPRRAAPPPPPAR